MLEPRDATACGRSAEPVVVVDGPAGTDPALAFDAGNTLWVAWTASAQTGCGDSCRLEDHFACKALSVPDGRPAPASVRVHRESRLPEAGGVALEPALAAPPDEPGVWGAWATRCGGAWWVRVVFLRRDGDEERQAVRIGPAAGGAFSPALLALPGHRLLVAFEAAGRGGEEDRIRLAVVSGDAPGATGAPGRVSGIEMAPAGDGRRQFRPALALDGAGQCWVVYEGTSPEGTSDLYARHVDVERLVAGRPVRIASHPADDTQPAVAAAPGGGLWVAWTSNRRGDGVDLPRWLYLARFDGERVVDGPYPIPPEQDPEAVGDLQGWESPALARGGRDALWVAGRSSSTFLAQCRRDGRWSERIELSGRGWGCRSRRIHLATDPAGAVWAVYRGVHDVRVERLPAPPPAAPAVPRPEAEPDTRPAGARRSPEAGAARFAFPIRFPSAPRRRATGVRRPDWAITCGRARYSVYFGDLHAHTACSDGAGSIDEFYRRSRDLYGDDFGAVTDHDRLESKVLTPSEWAYACESARRFHEPGRYVTFSGFEWTTPPHPKGSGHKHVLLPGDDFPLFRHLPEGDLGGDRGDEGPALLAYARRVGAIVIPHHVGWGGADLRGHDPAVQPNFEICSTHGSYEREMDPPVPYRRDRVLSGWFLQDFLRAGLRFGFTGGSDGHGLLWHHGAGWKRDDYRGGLTAILAPELGRPALVEALRARRCYATSGVPILLDVRLNGSLMGGVATVTPGDDEVALSVRVRGTAPIRAVHVVRDGDDVHVAAGQGEPELGFELVDRLPVSPGASATSYYYVRVVQEDGEVAWSSPIWVERHEG